MDSKELNLNIKPLVDLLINLVKCGKNAVYKANDIAYRILQSAIHNQSLEAMFKLTDYLSADRMLDYLHEIDQEEITKLIKKSNKNIKLPKKAELAIDFHEKEYYGNKNHTQVVGSKGGKYVRRFIEISCINPPLFLNAYPVNQFNNNKLSLLNKLFYDFSSLYKDTDIGLLLVDRGFFTKAVIKKLVRKNIPFIMPAIKNKAIEKLVELFKLGKINQRIRYKFGEASVTLAFLKVEDEVYVYVTNTNHTPVKLYLLYTKRWQIETNFREQNKFIFKTKTTNFDVRYLAFTIAGLLFNAWQLTRSKLKHIESYLYKQILIEQLLKVWQAITKREVIKNLNYFLLT